MFRFLGSIYFAIILISLTIIAIAFGTWIESKHGSHGNAAMAIYSHPLFQLLLMGYFVNILVSALRRWPFRKKHIPFLITHLGLLMIISGVMIKNMFGLQAEMLLIEGTASAEAQIPSKKAIVVETPTDRTYIPLEKVQVMATHPHAENKDHDLVKDLENATELAPPLQLMGEVLTPQEIVQYLRAWQIAGTYLFDASWKLDWKKVPEDDLKALYWIAALYDENDLMGHLKASGWPLIDPLLQVQNDREALYQMWMQQIYAARTNLPYDGSIHPKMLSAYLRLFGIHLDDIPSIKLLDPPLKQEDARPYVVILWQGKEVPLVFDPKGTKFTWVDHQTRIGFHLAKTHLPYEVWLHRAYDIKYPNHSQTLSYECDLSLKNLSTQKITHCKLRMNQVHETEDGYRFYLAGMGAVDDYGTSTVQLVISKDPVKAYLTLPGAVLVASGLFLLFFGTSSLLRIGGKRS